MFLKSLLYKRFPANFAKFHGTFFAEHLFATASTKYPFVAESTSALNCYSRPGFFLISSCDWIGTDLWSVIEPLLSETLSAHTYTSTSKDTFTGFSCDYIYVKAYFDCFISRKYAFTDVPQNRCSWNFLNIYRKTPVAGSLSPSRCFLDNF